MTFGVGLDLIEPDRILRIIERFGVRFTGRIFTPGEVRHCLGKGMNSQLCLAARFAAKEAFVKALGTGFTGGIRFRDIEVVTAPAGPPRIRLPGEALKRWDDLGLTGCHLSLSHERGMAAAVVSLEV